MFRGEIKGLLLCLVLALSPVLSIAQSDDNFTETHSSTTIKDLFSPPPSDDPKVKFNRNLFTMLTFLSRVLPHYLIFDSYQGSVDGSGLMSPIAFANTFIFMQVLMSSAMSFYDREYSYFVTQGRMSDLEFFQKLNTNRVGRMIKPEIKQVVKKLINHSTTKYYLYYFLHDISLLGLRFLAAPPSGVSEAFIRFMAQVMLSAKWMMAEYPPDFIRFKMQHDPEFKIVKDKKLSTEKETIYKQAVSNRAGFVWGFIAHTPGTILHLLDAVHTDMNLSGASSTIFDNWLISPGSAVWLWYGSMYMFFYSYRAYTLHKFSKLNGSTNGFVPFALKQLKLDAISIKNKASNIFSNNKLNIGASKCSLLFSIH